MPPGGGRGLLLVIVALARTGRGAAPRGGRSAAWIGAAYWFTALHLVREPGRAGQPAAVQEPVRLAG